MKNLIVLLLMFPTLVIAQIKNGNYYLQASLTLQTSGELYANKSGSSTNLNAELPLSQLGIGKFVNDRHAFSVFILGSIGSNEIVYNKNYSIGMGIGHCFIYPIKDQFGLLVNTEISGRYGKVSEDKNISNTSDYLQKYSVWKGNFSPGIYYLFFNKLWVQANIDWLNVEGISVQNNPNLTASNKLQAQKSTSVNGLFPGLIQLDNIHFKLSYLIQ